MENTVRDFVKMIYERECGVVVMLCGCEEGGVEICTQYWPTSAGTTLKYGEFFVSTVSVDTNDDLSKRSLTIKDPKVDFSSSTLNVKLLASIYFSQSGQVQKVTQFQVEHWNGEGMCSNSRALIDVIDQMGVVQRRNGNKPIVAHGM